MRFTNLLWTLVAVADRVNKETIMAKATEETSVACVIVTICYEN